MAFNARPTNPAMIALNVAGVREKGISFGVESVVSLDGTPVHELADHYGCQQADRPCPWRMKTHMMADEPAIWEKENTTMDSNRKSRERCIVLW
jgi:hypothetical protein